MSKFTLKEAIEASEASGVIKVTDQGREMILERPQAFGSRKGGKVCSVSKGKDRLEKKSSNSQSSSSRSKEDEVDEGVEPASSAVSLSNEAKKWRMAYMEVKRDQYVEKKEMEELLKLTIDRESQLASYARLLSRKIDSLIDPIGDSSAEAAELSAKLEEQRKLLRLYEIMTGISAREDDEPERKGGYVCTIKNRVQKKATRFALRKDKRAANIETSCHFVPVANVESLPDYVQTAIDFEPNMAPVLLADVLSQLYADDDE
jgi:predicted RNA-binding protein YlxR (DUF448 family)